MGLSIFSKDRKRVLQTNADTLSALSGSQAIISFDPEGIVLDANPLFLGLMGYELGEIRGHHHRMFVEPAHAASADYEKFWRDLREGKFQAATFKRLDKSGNSIWIEATYNPLRDANGKVYRIVNWRPT